jgi:hypothetical protein
MKIGKVLTSRAGTYIVTITQVHTERVVGHVEAHGLDDRVHRVEHPHRDTQPHERDGIEPCEPGGDQRHEASVAVTKVTVSDRLPERHRHAGAEPNQEPGWFRRRCGRHGSRQGTSATASGSFDRRDATYHHAMSEYVTRLSVN